MKTTIKVEREIPVIKIALTGKLRSGKDTVAHHLYIRHGFDKVAFGTALKRIAHETFPWVSEFSKPRALYQNVGQLMREIEPDVWIKHAERAVNGAIDFRVNTGAERVGVVITDVRQQNEVDWCRENGFTLIRITAPDENRIARAIAANDDFTVNDLTHETELAIDGFAVDFTVNNDKDIEHLISQIDQIFNDLEETNA
jgi:dephospho-CoA kinase